MLAGAEGARQRGRGDVTGQGIRAWRPEGSTPACPRQQAALSDAAQLVRVTLFFFFLWWPQSAALPPACYGENLSPRLLGWAGRRGRMQQIGLADACACACVPVGLSGCAKWPATVERNSPGLVEKRRKLKWVSCGQHISFPPTPPALRSAALRCGLANPVRLGRLFGGFPLFSPSCHLILRLRCDSFFFSFTSFWAL